MNLFFLTCHFLSKITNTNLLLNIIVLYLYNRIDKNIFLKEQKYFKKALFKWFDKMIFAV